MTTSDKPLLGISLMIAAMAVLPFLDVLAKTLGNQGVPILQIVWARLCFGALMTLPFAATIAGPRGLLPSRWGMHGLRALFLVAATFFFFWSLKFLAIADALAIFFVQPLVVTALSPFVLGETVGRRRWAAVAIGFIGTLIIIRPGFQAFNLGMGLALASGTSLALYMLLTRRISGKDHALVTTFHTNLLGALMTSALVPLVWQPLNAQHWLLFVGVGFFATFGHYLIVRAYDYGEASLLAPLAYSEMIMATILGWWFFGDFPDLWTFVGVAVLIGCAIYISMRQRASRAEEAPQL